MTGEWRSVKIVKCLIINRLTLNRKGEEMEDSLLTRAVRMTMRNNRLHRHMIDELVCEIGFARNAHMMLMHLARTEKSPSQRELADRFSITPAAVTGILKKLERDGYITRTVGRDTRFNEISITPLGREIVKRSADAFSEVDRRMFSGFSDEELELYIRLVEKINDNMEASKGGQL